jgi:endonuclease/exonuclease/phosphatase family metal-dependent hydrolase
MEDKPKPRRSFLVRILFWINIAFAVSLLLAHLASYVNPRSTWWIAMFGLGLGVFAWGNLIFLIFWIFRRDLRLLLSLFSLFIVSDKLLGIYEIRFSKPPELKNALKVMSFNVRLFDLYNWYHNAETKEKIFELLKEESPDIVCFQEFFTSESNHYDFDNKDTLRSILSCRYSHVHYTISLHDNKDHWGLATYSRYPIINKKVLQYDPGRRRAFIYSDIVFGKDTLRVMNVHLESIGFKAEDYKFVKKLGEEDQDELKGALNITRRLKRAFERRSEQAEMLQEEIRKSPYRVIVCGDFNDTPSSYTYKTVSEGLSDAYRVSGIGSGQTYIGVFPSFRIDYILHSKEMKSSGYTRLDVKLSDHSPVYCFIKPGP